jgi:protein kinase-like protein
VQIGPYTIERELGRGGMGAVYLGRVSPGAPPVAVKVVHTALEWDPDVEARFQAEGDALEALGHPNLVRLRGRGRGPGGHWIAMDYVEGQSLGARLKSHGPLANEAARDLLLGLCAGIAHAHHEGVLHRDLKPENVLLRASDQQPMIVDFGLARPLDLSQHLTATGEILGSPGYLAPEQCGSGGRPTKATDVYGLGALLYAVLTGEPPFREASVLATLDRVLSAAPRPPRGLRPEVAPWLEAICLRCLAKEPSERFPDASALADALAAGADAEASPRSRGGTAVGVALVAALGGAAWLASSALSPPGDALPSVTESPSFTASPPSLLWREGPWGAQHAALAERADPEALRARRELLAGEADEIELREEPWVARRARALEIAEAAALESQPAAIEWIRTIAIDDIYGDSLDELADLRAARDRARTLIGELDSAGRESLRDARARLELKTWRRLKTDEQAQEQAALLAAWERASTPDEIWWREAVRVEALTVTSPPEALEALLRIEEAAGGPSTQAWVEYLRASFLRRSRGNSAEYLGLLKRVGEWPDASPTLRAKALLLRGAQLELDEDPRAGAALKQVDPRALDPWRRLDRELRLARISLRAGDVSAGRRALNSVPSELPPSLHFPVGLLRVEVLAREGKADEAKRVLVGVRPPRTREETARVLYLRALLGQVDHAEALVESLATQGVWGMFWADRVLRQAAEDPLWPKGTGLERLKERVAARLAGSRLSQEFLRRLLQAGLWQELIAVCRATLPEKDPRRYASLVAHALLAAEELDVPKVQIARAAQEAATAVRGITSREAQARVLLGSFALRQTPAQVSEAQAKRTATYAETLERACAQEEVWAMGFAELIRLYTWAGATHPEFRGLATAIAALWERRQPESLAALTAACNLQPTPERVRLLNDKARAEDLTPELARAMVALRRWRRLTGLGSGSSHVLIHEPSLRLSVRRKLQLEDARRLLLDPNKSNVAAALVLLRRVERWCPVPEAERAAFELLQARALLEAGQLDAAQIRLTSVKKRGAKREEVAELLMLEARRLQLLGRPKKEIGAKVIASLAAGQTRESSLVYAQVFVGLGGGPASSEVYGQALGYERSILQIKRILREIATAGADPLLALEVGVRELAHRASAAKAFTLVLHGTKDLEESERLAELRALAMVRLSRARLGRGMQLPRPEGVTFMRGAHAGLARLLLDVHAVRRQARAPGERDRLVRLAELERALVKKVEGLPPETVVRWGLRWELAQISMDFAEQARTRRERVEHGERAEARFVEAEEHDPLELARAMDRAFVLGEVLGRLSQAAEVLEVAVKRAQEVHQRRFAGVLARARGVFLFSQGRFEETLSAVEVAIDADLEPMLRGEAYLQQAHALALLGREGVVPSLRRARISTPLDNMALLLEVTTLEARWSSRSLPEARRRLAQVEGSLHQLQAGPRAMVGGMIRVAEAELLRREGKVEQALALLAEAMNRNRLPPGAVDERLACHAALGGTKRAELRAWGQAVLKNPSLLPYEAERVGAALAAARD